MQTLAAYLLDRPRLTLDEAASRATLVSQIIEEWLSKKGAKNIRADTGRFPSLTPGAQGEFRRRRYIGENGVVEEIRLEEPSGRDQRFTTSLFVAALKDRVLIYVTLDVVNVESVLTPMPTGAKCPAVVRRLIEKFDDWELGGDRIPRPSATSFEGEAGAKDLIARIESYERTLPVVVVSQIEGDSVYEDLPDKLAFDLAGVASVASVDEDASWQLTDSLGRQNSCYQGAVRIYWPLRRRESGQADIPSDIWTASRIMSGDYDGKGEERFRSKLRRSIMSVAALALEPPTVISEVQRYESRRKLRELEDKTASQFQTLELAKLFEEDNTNLTKELAEARQTIASLLGRVESAEYALQSQKVPQASQVDQASVEDESPIEEETRFYKKIHSKPGFDVMVRVSDCGHNAWQRETKAEKAKKGIERLEGSADWKTLQHCGSCTGGGMWKVRW